MREILDSVSILRGGISLLWGLRKKFWLDGIKGMRDIEIGWGWMDLIYQFKNLDFMKTVYDYVIWNNIKNLKISQEYKFFKDETIK